MGGAGTGTPVTPPVLVPSTAFRDSLINDLDVIFLNTEDFAEEIIYTPKGGSGTPIDALLTAEDGTIQSATAPADNMQVTAKFADITNPQRGDTFTIGAVTWYFAEIMSGGRTEALWHIRVSRSNRPLERMF